MEDSEDHTSVPENSHLIAGDSRPSVKSTGTVGFPSCRLVLTVVSFFGFFNVYCLRVNLSVALVEMVKTTNDSPVTNGSRECAADVSNSSLPDGAHGEFVWSTNVQGLVLGAFFYGYIVTQVPGGWLAERFGGKWLFGGGVLCTAVLSLLTPLAARTHVSLLIALRVLEGIGEGVTFPAMHAILSNWAPPLERSKLATSIYAGAQMGTVVAMPVSGLLCKYGFAGGWPSVFYVFGGLGCLWFVFWAILCHDSPAKHPRISRTERDYLEQSIGHSRQKLPTPWKDILTSVPVYAVATAHVTSNWGFYTLLTCLPSYLREVIGLDISQNGFISGLPYLFTWMTQTLSGQVADTLRKRKLMSTTAVRKLFNTSGQVLPALFLVGTGYVGCDRTLAILMVTTSVGLCGLSMSGYAVNHLDIAPPFAGTLMGITNAMATIPGFVGPQVVGLLTNDNPSRGQWQIVFYIAGAIYVFGSLVYLLFGSGVEQPWARASHRTLRTCPDNDESEEDSDTEHIN